MARDPGWTKIRYAYVHGSMSYRELAEKGFDASNCVQCGACEAACPQHLNIIDSLASAWKDLKA